MNHLSEEQLILFYYGESVHAVAGNGDAEAADTLATEQHLEACGQCRALYGSLQRVLNIVDSLPVPDRSAEYGLQVWQRIRQQIPAGRGSRWTLWLRPSPWRWAAAGAAFAGLMVAAFLAGRWTPQHRPGIQMARTTDVHPNEGILMVAVGDYLERSQMVLIELANANPKGDLNISAEQQRAEDLVTETRLYRQTAVRTGDTGVSSVLDELEPVLLEIAHSPSEISPEQLDALRQRLDAAGILFKIRVLGSRVRNQETPLPSSSKAGGEKL